MIVRYAHLDTNAAAARRLVAANDPDRGVLVVQVRPDLRRPGNLAEDLLRAVGCRGDVSAATTSAAESRRLVRLWVRAHDLHTVVLVEAGCLRRPVVRPIVDDLARTGVDLWFADRIPQELQHEEWLRELGAVRGRLDELPLPRPRADQPEGDRHDLPDVPDDAFPIFRWACHEVLSETDFALVDDTYVATLTSVHRALTRGPRDQAGALVRGQALEALSRARGPNETTVVVRAIEAAAFRHGHLVRLDPVQLRRTGAHRSLLSDDEAWRRLRAYRQPERGVACLLAALGMTTGQVAHFPIGAVAANGHQIVVEGHHTDVPKAARVLLRAAVTQRLDNGATADAPLLLPDGGPATRHKVSRWLNDAACDLAVAVPTMSSSRGRQGSLRRLGLSLQEVA